MSAVTRHPTAQWTAQQMREATPFGVGPEFIIRDNDGKFGADFDRAAKGAGIRVLRTAVQAPLMNSVCERFLGSVRRDCLDHVIALGERHLSQRAQGVLLSGISTPRARTRGSDSECRRREYSRGRPILQVSSLSGARRPSP